MRAFQSNMDRYNIERQKQAEQRKMKVLDVAQGLFLEKGLANTTMNDIMTEAAISKATLYRYYKSIHPIAFEIEYRMLREIFQNTYFVMENDLNTEEIVFKSLLILIDEFHQHEAAYIYVGMFDNLYAKQHPSEQLTRDYLDFFETMNMKRLYREEPEKVTKYITSINVVLSFLERLATRGKLLEKNQEITVDAQLGEFRKMIGREFGNE